jgi:glycerate kinase
MGSAAGDESALTDTKLPARATVVIAPDKFKGSLTAAEVATVMAAAWQQVRPSDRLVVMPMADGGDGTMEVIAAASTGVRWVSVQAHNAVGALREVRYAVTADDTLLFDLAAVCGLAGLERPQPMRAHTLGLGEVLRYASSTGSRRGLVGLGGSASTDGGVGALIGLGAIVRRPNGALVAPGDDLRGVATIDLSAVIALAEIEVLVDTTATLFGATGAAALFGPQKGATASEVARLEAGLVHLSRVLPGEPTLPGAGAAGGTGYALHAAGARIVAGASRVAEAIGLTVAITEADLLITGEGRFDNSSHLGKVTGYVTGLAEAAGIPSVVIAGSVSPEFASPSIVSTSDRAGSVAASLAQPVRWLTETVVATARALT